MAEAHAESRPALRKTAGRLFGNTVNTMLISVLILVLNMATGVLTARWLGPEGRGFQMAMVLWPQFFAFTTTLGLPAALLFHVRREPERANSLYAAGMLIAFLTGVAAIGIGAAVVPLRLSGYPDWLVLASIWMMATVPFVHLFFLNNSYLQARRQFALFNRARSLVPLLTLALLLAFALTGGLTPLTAAASYQLAFVPVAIWAVVRGIKLFIPDWSAIREALGKLWSYGIRGYGVDLLGNLILNIDQILLVGILSPESLGLYVVAVSLSRMLNVFSTSVAMVLFPEASGLSAEEASRLSLRVYKISTLFCLLAALAMSALAPVVLGLLYGSEFLAAIPVFRLLLLEVVIGGAAMVLAQAFMASGHPGIVTFSLGLGLLVLVPLLLVLVPAYGVVGAGWSLLIATSVRLLFILVRFHLKFRPGFRAFWLNKSDFAWALGALKKRGMAKAGHAAQ